VTDTLRVHLTHYGGATGCEPLESWLQPVPERINTIRVGVCPAEFSRQRVHDCARFLPSDAELAPLDHPLWSVVVRRNTDPALSNIHNAGC
jgi:hypothetical protein